MYTQIWIIVCIACTLPILIILSPSKSRWVRMWDFPRVQLAVLALLILIASPCFWPLPFSFAAVSMTALLILSLLYLLWQIIPYTRLHSKVSKQCQDKQRKNTHISVLMSNVLMSNQRHHDIARLIKQHQPDLVILAEVNQQWFDDLAEIRTLYSHFIAEPRENRYGIAAYSNLNIQASAIHHLLDPEIPSIKITALLNEDIEIDIYTIHPPPPSPSEEASSAPRDNELEIVATTIGANKRPSIVVGDLNDVAWSRSTRSFQRLGKLQDPRIGRGMFNTFHAQKICLRWPLDHIFHSPHFSTVSLQVLEDIGSDHFPILSVLAYTGEEIHT